MQLVFVMNIDYELKQNHLGFVCKYLPNQFQHILY